MKRPEEVQLSREEGEALISRVEAADQLSTEDRRVLVKLIELWFWLTFALNEAKLSITRLKRLVFGQGRSSDDDDAGGSASATGSASASSAQPTPSGHSGKGFSNKKKAKKRKGHGRLSAEAYTGAKVQRCCHETLQVGQRCPACGRGKLYQLPEGVSVRIDGHALLSAMRYEIEKLRCSACGEIFNAELPDAGGEGKYSDSARSAVVLARYYLGLPFHRLEHYQAALGVPLPDATQSDLVEQVANCVYPVFDQLVYQAAQSELLYHDDTSVRILKLLIENRQAAQGQLPALARTGMATTGIVAQHEGRTIIVYVSGRQHAGENLSQLLEKRQPGLPKPLVMSDALAANTLANEDEVIRCYCLFHGRRQFDDLSGVFPQSKRVIDDLTEVFRFEAHTRQLKMTPEQRLDYHQQHSEPIMTALKEWLEQERATRNVEPNSSLGKAMAYLLTHWQKLTRFLSQLNAPLDSNTVERALKLMIRQRRNSLFFASAHSAYIGSLLTSLLATCLAAKVNVMDYLNALQQNRSAVRQAPPRWLPWNYTQALA